MKFVTKDDLVRARERLRRRDPEALAEFILSLVPASGPVADQARTFIVGDDVAETVKSVKARIAALSAPGEYEYRHAYGAEIGERLAFIVESIGSLVLPVDPAAAFELLGDVFERDGEAMEQCGEHHWEVQVALDPAAELMGAAAKPLPAADVAARIRELLANDGYGVRARLNTLTSPAADTP